MLKNKKNYVTAVLLIFIINGCATAYNLSELGRKKIYGGVLFSVGTISSPVEYRNSGKMWDALGLKFLCLLDLPFSLVADTLTLKTTIPYYLEKPKEYHQLISCNDKLRSFQSQLHRAKTNQNIYRNDIIRNKAYEYMDRILDDLLEQYVKEKKYRGMVINTLICSAGISGEKTGKLLVDKLSNSSLTLNDKIDIITAVYRLNNLIPASIYNYSKILNINDISDKYEQQQKAVNPAKKYLQSQNKSWKGLSAVYRCRNYDSRYWLVYFNKYTYNNGRGLIVDLVSKTANPPQWAVCRKDIDGGQSIVKLFSSQKDAGNYSQFISKESKQMCWVMMYCGEVL